MASLSVLKDESVMTDGVVTQSSRVSEREMEVCDVERVRHPGSCWSRLILSPHAKNRDIKRCVK